MPLPINIKTFFDTVMGNRSPITEKDFSKEELDTLRATIQRRQLQNLDIENNYRNMLYDTPQEYRRGPDTRLESNVEQSQRGRPMRLTAQPIPYTERQQAIQDRLKTYENTRDRTSIGYGDYPTQSGNMGAPVSDGWGSMLSQSLNDPAFRLASTLGSAKATEDDKHYNIKDRYRFRQDQQWFYNNASSKPLSDIVKQYWDRPGSLGEVLYRKYLGDAERPVNITLDK